MAGPRTAAEFDRRQEPPGRDIQTRQPIFATAADQRRERQSATLEGDQCRSVGDWAAPATTEPGGGRGAGKQDGAHRLGGNAATGGLPARGRGSLSYLSLAPELAREQ